MNAVQTRAPKGGITIMGVFYKGGQFLPTNEPQRGKWNASPKMKTPKKPRKVEVAPYNWVYPPDNKRSIFTLVGGTVATFDHDTKKLTALNNPFLLKFRGYTFEEVEVLCETYNNGDYFTD